VTHLSDDLMVQDGFVVDIFRKEGMELSKNERLNGLFDEWREHYRKYSIDSNAFSSDGIFDEEQYDQAPKRLLFILRETNSFPNGDLRILFKDGPKWNTFIQLSQWAAGIINNFPPFESLVTSTDEITKALRSIAVMNIKKFSGGAFTDFNLLHAFAFLDRDFIRREIDIISPQFIICCNTFIELMWALEIDAVKFGLTNFSTTFSRPYDRNGIRVIICPHHPAARGSHKDSYNLMAKLFETQGLLPS
jgi:hypothetical protein